MSDSNTRTRTVTWTDFAETGPVRCEAVVVHRGGRVATSEGKLFAEKGGKLLAHGTSTCMIIPR